MPVTVAEVIRAFPGWQIYDLAGGWAAVRTNLLPRTSGLSNVRCGETLEELVRHLEAETRPRGTA
ncbi:hypothetical protein HCN51_21835 [Nonomuraea sp. FMUSA5-5]|uniref:Uncharacterized protein n=1 Tax=Nonomuraea composti TaxID=2720023 RepID=A0ABX1B8K7_9ACTN|nr:hypothetical protein [Nonomuraea sp. FMUSA5-5]NJP92071.1 hypothetical protein [Nonomuraea sp. FMUSA5-5]